jgi:hypothetical protein
MAKTTTFHLRGVHYRSSVKELERYARHLPVRVELEREPDNEADENAIMVVVTDSDFRRAHIGYVPREIAADLAPRLDKEKITVAYARMIDVQPKEGAVEIKVKFQRQ